jgi:hypothetical protein
LQAILELNDMLLKWHYFTASKGTRMHPAKEEEVDAE